MTKEESVMLETKMKVIALTVARETVLEIVNDIGGEPLTEGQFHRITESLNKMSDEISSYEKMFEEARGRDEKSLKLETLWR